MINYKKQFSENGFIKIDNFLSNNEVNRLRSLIDDSNSDNKTSYQGFSSWEGFKESLLFMLSKKKIEILQKIFEKTIIYPDFVLQISNSPKKYIKPHWDLQSYIRSGQKNFINNTHYAKIGIYLQNSDKNNSGSIHYVPNSHRSIFYKLTAKLPSRISAFLDGIRKRLLKNKQINLDLNSGDLLAFDGRLLHSSSPKKGNKKKMVFYFSIIGDINSLSNYCASELNKASKEILSKKLNTSQRIEYLWSKNDFTDISNNCPIPIFLIDKKSITELKALKLVY
ncbi:phytanoyl-CoA dioxygenase family protein [Alphaproteobacteria bacterium]|nr:phytanoyl-CoA dioxygenase family protein [Alphaproteobacteria bacterium]